MQSASGHPDAIVVGSGPNGLVAANVLADAGWEVVVLEAQPEPGGAVRSAEPGRPGYVQDLFSSFYPLAAASPVFRSLHLEDDGLRWRRAPLALAHPTPDGRCAVLSPDVDVTAASLDDYAPGDGEAWRELYGMWERVHEPLVRALLSPFPPVRAGTRLALSLGPDVMQFARLALLSARRLAGERFRGEGGTLLLAGNTLHTDLSPEAAGGGLYGWILASLGQQVGFPVPEGGAGKLTQALVRRLDSRGGRVVCDARVVEIVVHQRRAVAVRTADGSEVTARRAVLADVGAPALYGDLVPNEHLPASLMRNLRTFEYDHATVKVDWVLDRPVPWVAEPARRAGTVHLGDSLDHLTEVSARLATGHVPAKPFALVGQMTTADPTRSPAGTETLWAYAHVPQRVRGDAGGGITGKWDEREADELADRIERAIEERAPGFVGSIASRQVLSPPILERHDANLVGGAVGGGTSQLHQQLVFRPTIGLARAETPVPGLFLASASAHPGGGVHGACGANAARAALAADRRHRFVAAITRAGG